MPLVDSLDTIRRTPLGAITRDQVAAALPRVVRPDPIVPTVEVAGFNSSI